jgi:hypothetical protein
MATIYGKPPKKLEVNGRPILIHEEAIIFKHGGKILGTIKAKYDLSELPSYLHEKAYKMLEKVQIVQYNP